jgi:hypothetical protein
MSLASSLSSVGSVEGCGVCEELATLPASKRRKLEDSQHEPLSPAAPDAYGRDEEGQDSVTAQVGRPYNSQRGLQGLGCLCDNASLSHAQCSAAGAFAACCHEYTQNGFEQRIQTALTNAACGCTSPILAGHVLFAAGLNARVMLYMLALPADLGEHSRRRRMPLRLDTEQANVCEAGAAAARGHQLSMQRSQKARRGSGASCSTPRSTQPGRPL